MPWNSAKKPDIRQKWGHVALIDALGSVQDFLLDEQAVNTALTQLNTATANCRWSLEFRRYIEGREANNGFNNDVVLALGWLPPSVFLSHVVAKKPVYDIGAGKIHGWMTHRVQWVLLGFHNQSHPFVPNDKTLADLYAAVGGAVQPDNTSANLWNDLLDKGADAGNACSPEYLHSTLVKKDYPRLFDIWL